jgi:hypothetical protein
VCLRPDPAKGRDLRDGILHKMLMESLLTP